MWAYIRVTGLNGGSRSLGSIIRPIAAVIRACDIALSSIWRFFISAVYAHACTLVAFFAYPYFTLFAGATVFGAHRADTAIRFYDSRSAGRSVVGVAVGLYALCDVTKESLTLSVALLFSLFSPPENDSFRKDFCFTHDVFFLSSRDLRDAWADRREILHDGQY